MSCEDGPSEEVLRRLASEFESITGFAPKYDNDFRQEALALARHLSGCVPLPFEVRRHRFFAHVNRKFRVNADGLRSFYRVGAQYGFTFNYHEKNEIQHAFDSSSTEMLHGVLARAIPRADVKALLLDTFKPVPPSRTMEVLRSECQGPSRLRRPQGDRNVTQEILQAQFAAFLFCTLEPQEMHRYFDHLYSDDTYRESFWEELHARSPHLFNRDHALFVVRVDDDLLGKPDAYLDARNRLCAWVAKAYDQLNNYSYLALLIEPIRVGGRTIQWELAADATLFGEKHREIPLRKAYFRWRDVMRRTAAYIADVNVAAARFELVNEGFTYKDCFVLASSLASQHEESSLLLLLQKNERDETLIPCPACRSRDVQGNSYPSLGVRSWECKNLLCPDRSKYNRGKRYSFKGLLMQQAIDDENNEIPAKSVRSWLRDVQVGRSHSDVLEMLLRHYSLHGDRIHVFNWSPQPSELAGRWLLQHKGIDADEPGRVGEFYTGPLFARYLVKREHEELDEPKRLGDETFEVLCGDAYSTLQTYPRNSFDGAVTSPPYYNARDYSQWDNIYCYLNDMFNVAAEVHRCLKPGAIYLYNIFDYFDNERSVVFSDMGKKRMILSAYTVDMFRRVGFECIGNIAWDKGDIEGKRGFNAGNFSPYYQSPFNCWEHVLIFRKPRSSVVVGAENSFRFPAVLRARPVIKMVRGKNTHGHTAPFPDDLPALLASQLPKDARILDPFGGSLTTGRVAEWYGLRSVCIEQHEEYCNLGITMREDDRERRFADEPSLF